MGHLYILQHCSDGHEHAAHRSLALPLDFQQSSHQLKHLGPTKLTLSGPNCLTAISAADIHSTLCAMLSTLRMRTEGLLRDKPVKVWHNFGFHSQGVIETRALQDPVWFFVSVVLRVLSQCGEVQRGNVLPIRADDGPKRQKQNKGKDTSDLCCWALSTALWFDLDVSASCYADNLK